MSASAERSSRSDSGANVKEGGREQKRFNGSDSCNNITAGSEPRGARGKATFDKLAAVQPQSVKVALRFGA